MSFNVHIVCSTYIKNELLMCLDVSKDGFNKLHLYMGHFSLLVSLFVV